MEQVKRDVYKILSKQKQGTPYDLSACRSEIDDLFAHIPSFNQDWKRSPTVFRIAKVKALKNTAATDGDATAYAAWKIIATEVDDADAAMISYYTENIILPDVPHDLDLIMKMLNHMREEKKLRRVELPVFLQPSEIGRGSGSQTLKKEEGEGRDAYFTKYAGSRDIEILSQMCLGFQKGAIMFVGFVFGRNYAILEG